MKKLSAVIILGAAIAAFATAEGVQEPDQWRRSGRFAAETESVELDGTYQVLDGHPAIQADGTVYSLSAPGYMHYPLELETGDPLSVEGLLFDCEGQCDKGADGHVRVTAAVMNGKTYRLTDHPWGRGEVVPGPRRRGGGYRYDERTPQGRGARRQAPGGRGPAF
jgi:hypothetical protein